MTFATLRALQAIIGDAIDEIYAAYASENRPHSGSLNPNFISLSPSLSTSSSTSSSSTPPPSPKQHRSPTPPLLSLSDQTLSSASHYSQSQSSGNPVHPSDHHPPLDFPDLNLPGDPSSPAEQLTSRPDIANAISRIVAAASQLAIVARSPFLTICDATMIYHLPSCLRFFEASHIPELLSAAGPAGLSVIEISASVGVDSVKISHVLRLLATHHIIRECEPDIFALNRVSALLDSGRSFTECRSAPEKKYDAEYGSVAAFTALNTDELFKASAYFTDALLPSLDTSLKRPHMTGVFSHNGSTEQPVSASSMSATNTPSLLPPITLASGPVTPTTQSVSRSPLARAQPVIRRLLSRSKLSGANDDRPFPIPVSPPHISTPDIGPVLVPTAFNLSQHTTLPYWSWLETPENSARLARFARAMTGTEGWMGASDTELCAFPFPDLAEGSLVVDVGGGIGSTTLRLAERFSKLRFIIQDREPVCRLGEDAWHIHSPTLIKSGRVRFQVHDFFKPQPTHAGGDIKPAVFLLRVICHDWPDTLARRILLQLRRAADEGTNDKKPTYLVIGDHLLPYACTSTKVSELRVEGGTEALRGARWPLLVNLGAASANAYWMDMTMQVTLGGQERTLPELRSLAESAGWRLLRVARAEGSLFAHVVLEPGPLPSGSGLGTPFPSSATITPENGEEEILSAITERGTTPVMDMLSAARTLLRARAGGKKGSSGESVWARWTQRKNYADENDARREPTGFTAEKSIPMPSQGGQGRGLLKKVSQYFGEGG